MTDSAAVAYPAAVVVSPTRLSIIGTALMILVGQGQTRLVEEPNPRDRHRTTNQTHAANIARFLTGIGRIPEPAPVPRLA